MVSNKKVAAAVLSAVMVSGGALSTPIAAMAMQPNGQGPDSTAAEAAEVERDGLEGNRIVQGAFSFTQDRTSSMVDISQTFAKAAAALCSSMPVYGGDLHLPVAVTGPKGYFDAIVHDYVGEGDQGVTMACSCATNGPGGGAMVNATVAGVLLEALATKACA